MPLTKTPKKTPKQNQIQQTNNKKKQPRQNKTKTKKKVLAFEFTEKWNLKANLQYSEQNSSRDLHWGISQWRN